MLLRRNKLCFTGGMIEGKFNPVIDPSVVSDITSTVF